MEPKALEEFKGDRCWSEIPAEEYRIFLMDAPLRLDEVWKVALEDKAWSWRCAWLIARFVQDLRENIHPRRLELLAVVEEKASGHQRELLRIIAGLDLDKNELGPLYDRCLNIWTDVRASSGTRSLAMGQMIRVATELPEFNSELQAVSGAEFMESLSSGIRRSLEKKLETHFADSLL
ncbi:MAG: Uncharacterised protein [Flavobacteriia bacterium]|nr:MAG: Uncharacterised protein [Flavobacteriia bacterium]